MKSRIAVAARSDARSISAFERITTITARMRKVAFGSVWFFIQVRKQLHKPHPAMK